MVNPRHFDPMGTRRRKFVLGIVVALGLALPAAFILLAHRDESVSALPARTRTGSLPSPSPQPWNATPGAGAYSGVGLSVMTQNGLFVVTGVIPRGPSDKAGLQALDTLSKIDGRSTQGMSLLQIVRMLTGPEGSKVKVEVVRRGSRRIERVLVRRKISGGQLVGRGDPIPPVS